MYFSIPDGVTYVLFPLLQIVDVNLTSEGKVKLETDMELPFTYQVCGGAR